MAVCASADTRGDVSDTSYGDPCGNNYVRQPSNGADPTDNLLDALQTPWPQQHASNGEAAIAFPCWPQGMQNLNAQGEYGGVNQGIPFDWQNGNNCGVNGAWGNGGASPGGDGGWQVGNMMGQRISNGIGGNMNAAYGMGRAKRRFCTSFPDVELCRRGSACAFAHAREDICAPLLEIEEERQDTQALTDNFFMYKYKTHWCPIGVQHEWHTCVYAHNYQDARRPVSIGYGARLCPYWSKKETCGEYSQRCPLGLRCPYSHGAKEQLYHPHYFKTVICRDLRGKACPRQRLCAFFHNRQERRASPQDGVDYTQPLENEDLPSEWVSDFLSPPFLPEGTRGMGEDNMNDGNIFPYGTQVNGSESPNGAMGGMLQMPQQFGQCAPGQQPMVFLMPMQMGGMMPNQMQQSQESPWCFMPTDAAGTMQSA